MQTRAPGRVCDRCRVGMDTSASHWGDVGHLGPLLLAGGDVLSKGLENSKGPACGVGTWGRKLSTKQKPHTCTVTSRLSDDDLS